MARDNARPVPWWRWCARVLLAVCALAVLIVGVANVVTVATTRDRVVTVEGAATALAGDAADAVVVLGASVYADGTPSDIWPIGWKWPATCTRAVRPGPSSSAATTAPPITTSPTP